MENQNEIYYARFKESFSDKVIQKDNKFVVQRKFKTKGYDSLIHEWVNVPSKSRERILPVSEIGLFKDITQILIIKRTCLNDMLRPLEVYIKLTRKIEVLDKSNNIFVKLSSDRAWQTDLTTTCMISLNHVPAGLKITNLKEEKLTANELQKLNEDLMNPKILLKPQIIEELPNGERRLLVS